MDPLTLSIGIGLIVGLVFVSLLGLSTGGMVVPGYFALEMGAPDRVIITIIISIAIFGIVRLMSKFMIIYGRRRIAITVLLSFILGTICNNMLAQYMTSSFYFDDIKVIGYIIPGLITLSIDRQGLIETIGSLLIASVIIRLLLIVLIGPQIVGI
ncbi:poly-gamma-glutamate biosynthesis protein PgsC [Allofrancisella guangzhouensis]|uniref:Capsule biosynthesis protein CapC n=1 Tax=Allofrancisella guangzhouensis TaxID=594679 RepID=A0A0A8E4Y5_9GAMM|nr:poly-gamma-glutamate biosynthesis protein PgsC [Allofrancisella guangzhouensis]AJC49300.1 capsule biosynthesis protein CapC [Allofrancisella guangzhouensis]MBK2027199.1 poly-gamma-glutamate biosynthesis protein PgsC [Allofrancisella guangzhouensis]MBK2044635.1 poly-gamma-glutamate biosynthesis protein PgsC [Allofrancisella guangzhouensis]MBK2045082.1 poly-gamma-glutamate biosynthesis protein PgsC [Allofrancisella guangzhouensis]